MKASILTVLLASLGLIACSGRPEHLPADPTDAPTEDVEHWRSYCATDGVPRESCNACASESGCGWCGASRSCLYREDLDERCEAQAVPVSHGCDELPEDMRFADDIE